MSINWKSLVAEGKLTIGSVEEAMAKNIFPNRLAWVPEQPSVGAIVAFQSTDDFAIGQESLSYIAKSLREGRIREGYVLLLRKQGTGYTLVRCATVEQVSVALAGRPPRDGKWGPFWWVPAELTPELAPF